MVPSAFSVMCLSSTVYASIFPCDSPAPCRGKTTGEDRGTGVELRHTRGKAEGWKDGAELLHQRLREGRMEPQNTEGKLRGGRMELRHIEGNIEARVMELSGTMGETEEWS